MSEANRNWWLVIDASGVDLCAFDPGHELDLLVTGPLRSMTSVWLGVSTIGDEVTAGRIVLDGDPGIARAMRDWLGLSPFAATSRRVP